MFPKIVLRRAYHIVCMNEERDLKKLITKFKSIQKERDTTQIRACIFIAEKFQKLGYTQETIYKVWDSIEDGSIYDRK